MKKISVLVFLSSILLIACSSKQSHHPAFPAGCTPVGYTHKDLYVHLTSSPKHSGLYLLYNDTMHKVVVDHVLMHDPAASAGWGTIMQPKRYSAILIDLKNFRMQCQKALPNFHYVVVPCKTVLHVCQFKTFKTKSVNQLHASYWVAENQTASAILPAIHKRGMQP